jgi:hypothetical protein
VDDASLDSTFPDDRYICSTGERKYIHTNLPLLLAWHVSTPQYSSDPSHQGMRNDQAAPLFPPTALLPFYCHRCVGPAGQNHLQPPSFRLLLNLFPLSPRRAAPPGPPRHSTATCGAPLMASHPAPSLPASALLLLSLSTNDLTNQDKSKSASKRVGI